MSEFALQRIKEAIGKLSDQQAEICERLSGLEGSISRLVGEKKLDDRELIAFLDQFRAGEALGEASLGAWIAVSDTACVRGGLRTVQQREGMHARLLAERLRELGAEPRFEIPVEDREKAMKSSASTEKTDAQKLLEYAQRYPDIDAVVKPIEDIADKLDHDPETQYLLRTIVQDERSTLEFLASACALLNS
ncbi:MAG: hypothetical protein V3R91_05580 [Myxococcota bacterium]|jgi:hypothetical protein